MADGVEILGKRLARAVRRAHLAEGIAEDTSRALYLEKSRLEEVLEREAHLRTELETLLDAMEAFLLLDLGLCQIAAELLRYLQRLVPCVGLSLVIEGIDEEFVAGRVEGGSATHRLHVPMAIGDGDSGMVTLLSYEPWVPELDLRLPRIVVSGASGAVKNALAIESERHRAMTDPLTNLVNRRGLEQSAGRVLASARNAGTTFAVAVVDLDFFKVVNDTYGHATGDEALVAVADVLMECTRDRDIAARLGGDEFCVVVVDSDLATASRVIERIRRAVRSQQLGQHGNQFTITVSIGLTELMNSDVAVDDVLSRADEALYLAKARGRDCWASIPSI